MSLAQKEYGWTVAGSGFWKMWRGFLPFVLVSVVNALVQAGLLLLSGSLDWLAIMLSAAVLLLSFAAMTQIALISVRERSGLSAVRARHLARFSLWVVLWAAVILIGWSFYTVPGILILVATPFVPVAAAAGRDNPLSSNFSALRTRPWRSLSLAVTTLLVGLITSLLAALNAFFIRGFVASFSSWLMIGFVAAWLLTAWASLYRSTPAGLDLPATDESAQGS